MRFPGLRKPWPTCRPTGRDTRTIYIPVPPLVQTVPSQEAGQRPARALPYAFDVEGRVERGSSRLALTFENRGRAGASFFVQSGDASAGPWSYTVEARKSLSDTLGMLRGSSGQYDFRVHGPNGFLRVFRGAARDARGSACSLLEVSSDYVVADGGLRLRLTNRGASPCRCTVANAYGNDASRHYTVRAGETVDDRWDLRHSHNWYDLSVSVNGEDGFLRRLAGHIETGRHSLSDPALGG
jgi:phospholipase C